MEDDEKILIEHKFAKFLREKRIALGMTLRQFAIHIYNKESKFSYLGEMERGTRKPTLTTAQFILDKLNCKLNIEEL